MALTLAARLAESGVDTVLAKELSAQLIADDGDGLRLHALGMTNPPARGIAAAIDAQALTPLGNQNRLMEAGVMPETANIIVDTISGA